MDLCPVCGSQMSYVSQYQQWYCNYCQGYRQPRPQQYQQPPPPPPPQQTQVQQVQYQQPAQQPHQYPPPAQQQYGAPQYAAYGQTAPSTGYAYGQEPKVASAYYLAIVALIFAFLGGIVGMILAAVAGWLAKKQAARGLAKAQLAKKIANLAFVISIWVFVIIVVVVTW